MLLSMLFWIRRLHTALQTQPLTVDPAISGGESFYRSSAGCWRNYFRLEMMAIRPVSFTIWFHPKEVADLFAGAAHDIFGKEIGSLLKGTVWWSGSIVKKSCQKWIVWLYGNSRLFKIDIVAFSDATLVIESAFKNLPVGIRGLNKHGRVGVCSWGGSAVERYQTEGRIYNFVQSEDTASWIHRQGVCHRYGQNGSLITWGRYWLVFSNITTW